MREVKDHIITGCISFTLVSFFYAILGELRIANEINNHTLYDLLIICGLISVVMFFTDKIPFKTVYSIMGMNLLDIFLVVFLVGGLALDMFPMRMDLMVSISVMILVIYFIVFGVMAIKNQADADCINKKINAARRNENE